MLRSLFRRELVLGVLALLAVAPYLVMCTPPAQRPTRSGSTQTVSIAAADAPGGHRQVWIYRPAVPDSASLPVLYFLHGLPGQVSDLAGTGIAAQLDFAFSVGAVRPFVLAAPDGASTGASDPEWADSVDGRVRLETFITGDLIDAVEGGQRRDRGHRAIAGFSMGGYGAANIALRHTDLFGQFASLAGYFHVDDPSGVFGQSPAVQAANSPDRHLARARMEHILLVGGMQDGLALTGSEDERFAGLLRAAGMPVTHYTPAGTHSWEFVSSSLPFVELFLDRGWT
jgi:S-formylglutathione hydrolase FrmB